MASWIRGFGSVRNWPAASVIGRIWGQRLGAVGLVCASFWIVVAIGAPLLASHNPLAQDAPPLLAPSINHWFGTDELGRDEFSRIIWGARMSVPLAFLLNVVALLIGVTLGGIAGFFGGWIEEIIMRLTDLVFSFPTIILAMVVTAALGPSVEHAVLAIVLVYWPGYARLSRGMVKAVVNSDYVSASRLVGTTPARVLLVDVSPNVVGPIAVLATLHLGDAILLLAALSFLGLGAQPPAPEWGAMISIASGYVTSWWLAVFPGLAILSVVLGFNLIGDTVRDIFDPNLAIV